MRNNRNRPEMTWETIGNDRKWPEMTWEKIFVYLCLYSLIKVSLLVLVTNYVYECMCHPSPSPSKHGNFFFFYGESLMDVASQTAWRKSPLSSACLPASIVETPIHSPMSFVHLLLGLPLPLLPSHVPSKNSFSNVLCRLMWQKNDKIKHIKMHIYIKFGKNQWVY